MHISILAGPPMVIQPCKFPIDKQCMFIERPFPGVRIGAVIRVNTVHATAIHLQHCVACRGSVHACTCAPYGIHSSPDILVPQH